MTQNTVAQKRTLNGVGLHSGKNINLTIAPAPENSGIVFVRTDIENGNNIIPALWDKVSDTQLCTVISNDEGVSVGTIEHLMSALRGCNIDNVLIELDGAEVPIMDGSAIPFVELVNDAGILAQQQKRRVIRVLKNIAVEKDGKRVELSPATGSVFGGEIEFDHPQIGAQKFETALINGNFVHDIANCRTFGFYHEGEYLQSIGLALGASLDNAIVLDREKIMNPEGLRHEQEFIRHKLLDAIGDLYLAGFAIEGKYEGFKAGHAMNNEILHALFADESAYEVVEA
ncbi:MAG: UDP-3-O-[3-hydroxymyristoyl] N-acetylglucosamine deacetylase [Micavibrio sp. TMED27]|nr:UDP-3-O-[3-hydroxymyristoyl] N-acetylglucosamine deacetylase [Micavibrio sp.]OUT90721.1 MAG: UDP-3-O-[3-hydroxymyristoyl] N-acetylglucosamine deacetylase [Micavibrio sp. TMED27]|tara:strand:+ start:2556 stop:3413 length:858 start_codon:yes stop_codon:yes gene_type:complete